MPDAKKDLTGRKTLLLLVLLAIAVAVFYATSSSGPWKIPESAKQIKNPLSPSDSALNEIRPIYLDKCAVCHGDSGKGDGHDASRYNPRPTNLADPQHINSVSDGELFYKISEGHRPMPSFRKRLGEEQRWQLVLMIRSFTTK
jgi:mono/diheme cytochrome c family protein